MIRKLLVAFALLLAGHTASAQCAGYFEGSYNDAGYYSSGYFEENNCVATPDVVGLSQAAADAALMLAGLDTGNVVSRCSNQASGEVIDQIPPAGTVLALGSLVDINISNGVPCEGQRSRLWLNLEVKP